MNLSVSQECLNIIGKANCFLFMSFKKTLNPRLFDAESSPGMSESIHGSIERHLAENERCVGARVLHESLMAPIRDRTA